MLSKGFMVLACNAASAYRGADREPFVPSLIQTEIVKPSNPLKGEGKVWMYYSPGWRRDAYKLYEDNLAITSWEELSFINNKNVALQIASLILPHLGPHEVMHCGAMEINMVSAVFSESEDSFLGYDLAYPGGDYYSAIFNGLIYRPNPTLVERYGSLINKYGLFSDHRVLSGYLADFQDLVPSEKDSTFIVYRMSIADS